jgi:hypothetical protein
MADLPSPRIRDNWWFIPTLVCGCSGTGLVAAVILMHTHLEKYALLAGISMLIIAVLPWIGNALR